MSLYSDIIKVFDAKFHPNSLDKHWEDHKYGSKSGKTQLPKQMTKTQYAKKAEHLSLQKIDGKKVRAFKYQGNRIAKTNGQWFTAYADGKDNGNINSCFPAGYDYWLRAMKAKNGVEIFKE